MATEHSHQTHLIKSRELIAIADRLNEEYAALQELSRVLRRDSMQLSEDSRILRRQSTRLLWNENP